MRPSLLRALSFVWFTAWALAAWTWWGGWGVAVVFLSSWRFHLARWD